MEHRFYGLGMKTDRENGPFSHRIFSVPQTSPALNHDMETKPFLPSRLRRNAFQFDG